MIKHFFIRGLISVPILVIRIFVLDATFSRAYGAEQAQPTIAVQAAAASLSNVKQLKGNIARSRSCESVGPIIRSL